MQHVLETLGNATLVFYEDGRPILATDPWLEGRCYSGSWALDRKLTDSERAAVLDAEYIWISHGHPDHFHIPSLATLPRGKKILLPLFLSLAAWCIVEYIYFFPLAAITTTLAAILCGISLLQLRGKQAATS